MRGAPKVTDPKLGGCSCPEQEAMSQPENSSTTFTLGGFRYELLLEMRNLIPKVAGPKLCGCSCPEQEAISQPETVLPHALLEALGMSYFFKCAT